MSTTTSTSLERICENAAAAGRSIDLAGCDYGPHKRSGLYLGVQPYYHFLAGFVQSLGLRKILEIGTSFGGSMMALDRGCGGNRPGVALVTVDKTAIAGPSLASLAHIRRILGDSTAPATLREVRSHLSPPIDLLYIDSKHSYDHTGKNIAIYATGFRPRFVILDDIHLNPEMDRFWTEMKHNPGQSAFDASDLASRPSGFGILDYAGATPL